MQATHGQLIKIQGCNLMLVSGPVTKTVPYYGPNPPWPGFGFDVEQWMAQDNQNQLHEVFYDSICNRWKLVKLY